MFFSYIRSNILCRCLNILCNHVHCRTVFTPKIHPPPPPWPAPPPGPPPHQGQPPHPACLPSQTALPSSSATTVSRALQRASAVLVLLQRLCVWVQVNVLPPPIFYTHHLIFYIPPPKFCLPHLIFYVTHLICYVPPPILYVKGL